MIVFEIQTRERVGGAPLKPIYSWHTLETHHQRWDAQIAILEYYRAFPNTVDWFRIKRIWQMPKRRKIPARSMIL